MKDERKKQHVSQWIKLGEDVNCPNRNQDQVLGKFTGR